MRQSRIEERCGLHSIRKLVQMSRFNCKLDSWKMKSSHMTCEKFAQHVKHVI